MQKNIKFLTLTICLISLSGCLIKDKITIHQVEKASKDTSLTVKPETDSGSTLLTVFAPIAPVLLPFAAGHSEIESKLSRGFSGSMLKENFGVGLLFDRELENYKFVGGASSMSGGARSAEVPLGEVIFLNAPRVLDLAYNEVNIIRDLGMATEGEKLIFKPKVKDYSYKYAGAIHGRVLSNVTLETEVYNYNGEKLSNITTTSGYVDQQFDAIGSEFSSESHASNHAYSATKAVIVSFAEAVGKLRSDPTVKAWIKDPSKFAKNKKEEDKAGGLPDLKLACTHWVPGHGVNGITDLDKANEEVDKKLKDGFKSLKDLFKNDQNLADYQPKFRSNKFKIEKGSFNVANNLGKKVKVSADNAQKLLKITDLVIKGDYKKASEESADMFMSAFMPLVASYKTLMDAVATSINSVIANWVEGLYLTEEYQEVVGILTKEWQLGARDNKPYMISAKIKGGGTEVEKIITEMRNREKQMFNKWLNKFGGGMDEFMQGNAGLLRQAFGKDLTERQLFNRFLMKAYSDQEEDINEAYKSGMEYNAFVEAEKTKKRVVAEVCSKAYQAQIEYDRIKAKSEKESAQHLSVGTRVSK